MGSANQESKTKPESAPVGQVALLTEEWFVNPSDIVEALDQSSNQGGRVVNLVCSGFLAIAPALKEPPQKVAIFITQFATNT